MFQLERLTCCSCLTPKKHVGGESNFVTDKSKFRKKVYVSKLFHVIPDLFHYINILTRQSRHSEDFLQV